METHSFQNCKSLVLTVSALRPLSTFLPNWFVFFAPRFKTLWLSHHVPTEKHPKTVIDIALTVKTVAGTGLPCQDLDKETTFPSLQKLTSPTSGTPPETATITGITPTFASLTNPITTNETEVPVLSVAMTKNAKIWPNQSFHSSVQSIYQSRQKWPIQAPMRCRTPKFRQNHLRINKATAQGTKEASNRLNGYIQWWMTKVWMTKVHIHWIRI